MLSALKFSRRQILGAAAGAVVAAALGDVLLTYPPWLDYERQAARTWDTPFRKTADMPAQMRELIRYATLAPSGHNTQPWRFEVAGSSIRLFPDYSRRLPIVDPTDRELWISLGCALENLLIAAQYAGYTAEVASPEAERDFLSVHLERTEVPNSTSLFDAIPHRQNTRTLYDRNSVPLADLAKIDALAKDARAFPLTVTGTRQKEALLEYVKEGDRRQYGDRAFVGELVSWIRFNKAEALHTEDGLYTPCSGSPQIPRWLGKRFVTNRSAAPQSVTDEKGVRSAAGLLVIAAAHDDKRHWIETGRLYQRLALTLTACHIKVAFLNQPIEDVRLRSQLQTYLSLGAAQPQLLLRFGYADTMPRSLRRPVEQVLRLSSASDT